MYKVSAPAVSRLSGPGSSGRRKRPPDSTQNLLGWLRLGWLKNTSNYIQVTEIVLKYLHFQECSASFAEAGCGNGGVHACIQYEDAREKHAPSEVPSSSSSSSSSSVTITIIITTTLLITIIISSLAASPRFACLRRRVR